MNKNTLLIAVGVVILIGGTVFVISRKSKEQVAPQTNKATLDIADIINNKPTLPVSVIPTMVTELKIEDIKVGEGVEVKSGDTIVINYLGTFLDGTKFDSSYDRGQPFETQIGVGRVIKGWDEGVIGMKVGGKRKLTIPPDKAYGEQGSPGGIPPNSTLIFELELLAIK